MIYLAAPFSTGLPPCDSIEERQAAMQERANAIAKRTAELMELGEPVYSPISHGCAIEQFLRPDLRASHGFWMQHCYQMLEHARGLTVLMLPGWKGSEGVQKEINFARQRGIPITYMEA